MEGIEVFEDYQGIQRRQLEGAPVVEKFKPTTLSHQAQRVKYFSKLDNILPPGSAPPTKSSIIDFEKELASSEFRGWVDQMAVTVAFVGPSGVGKTFLVNSLLQTTYRDPKTSNFDNSYLETQWQHKIEQTLQPDESFIQAISWALEKRSVQNMVDYIVSGTPSIDDEHSFILPQGRFGSVTPRIRYGSIPELLCTFPEESELRAALWELHEVEQGNKQMDPADLRHLKERYELVFGVKREALAPEYTISPQHLPIPEAVRRLLGKSYRFRGQGQDFNVDRIYIREKMKQLISGFGFYGTTFLLRVPCAILEGNIEFIISDSDTMDRISKNRTMQAVQSANLLAVCTPADVISRGTRDLLLQSGFLRKVLTSGLEHRILFLEMQKAEVSRKTKRGGILSNLLSEYSAAQKRKMAIVKEFRQMLLKDCSPIFLDKERIEQTVASLPILPLRSLLYLSLHQNPSIPLSKLDGQPLTKAKSMSNVPTLILAIQQQIFSMYSEKTKKTPSTTTTPSLSPASASSPNLPMLSPVGSVTTTTSTTPSMTYRPKSEGELPEKIDMLASSFKEKLSTWKNACTQAAEDINKLAHGQPTEMTSTFWKNTMLDNLPKRLEEMMHMSNNLLLECTRMVETSPDASPIEKARMKRFVGVYQLMNERSVRGRLLQLKQEIDQDATEVANVLRNKGPDGRTMDLVPGIPPEATEGVQMRFRALLAKVMQQLQLLEADLQNSVTCVYKMRSILTPGKEKCADPVEPLPSRNFLPSDQIDGMGEADQRNKQLQFRVQRREPTTIVDSDYVVFDEKNAPRLFSNEVWNFKFGSQGAPFRHRFQEQLKRVGLKLVDIRCDGNSQFRAFAEQVYGSEELHSLVRFVVMKDVLANSDHYADLFQKGTNVQEYVDAMAKDGSTGDHITLAAMASVYGADMLIYSPAFPRPVLIRSRFRATERAYCLAYVNRHQYQALRSSNEIAQASKQLPADDMSLVNPAIRSGLSEALAASSCSTTPSTTPVVQPMGPPISLSAAMFKEDRMDLEVASSPHLGISPISSTSCSTTPGTTPTALRNDPSAMLSPDQGKNKIRKLNVRRVTQMSSLIDLCLSKIAEYVEFLPNINDALPEDLAQRLLTYINKEGKIDDQVLEKILDSSMSNLDLSNCKQILDSSCNIIATKCAYIRRLVLAGCLNITSAGLEAIAQRCPQLEELDIEGCVSVDDAGVQAIARHCNQLRVINLAGCVKLTNATVRDLSCLCPEIASISLKKCSQITDPTFNQLGNKLQLLDLSECPQITDSAVSELARKACSQSMQSLKLAGKNITDASIQSLAAQCPNLRDLELIGCESITDSSVHFLARSCLQLRSLNLSQCKNISDGAFIILNEEPGKFFSALQSLDLTRCTKVSDEGVCAIARNCRGLIYLNLTSCEGVTDASIFALANSCEYIRTLVLAKCQKVTDASVLELVRKCSSLTALDLQRCGITDQAVMTIAAICTQLRELDISCTDKTTDACIPHLANLVNLESLGLEDVRLTEAGVGAIANCTSLTSLKLAYSVGVTDSTLEKLAQLSLRTLDLSYCNSMTATGLTKALARWPQLKNLVLRGFNHLTTEPIEHSNIENLTLSWCKHLEDKTVLSLVECPRLVSLDLAWCAKVTGNSLHKLAQQCALLKTLNLRGCNKITYLTLKFLKASGRMVYR